MRTHPKFHRFIAPWNPLPLLVPHTSTNCTVSTRNRQDSGSSTRKNYRGAVLNLAFIVRSCVDIRIATFDCDSELQIYVKMYSQVNLHSYPHTRELRKSSVRPPKFKSDRCRLFWKMQKKRCGTDLARYEVHGAYFGAGWKQRVWCNLHDQIVIIKEFAWKINPYTKFCEFTFWNNSCFSIMTL